MCGIAGYLHFDKERQTSKSIIKKMTDIIAHRGPDGEGFYLNKFVALGHRRLAIIDLSSGEQPMYSHDGQIVVVFNGEIYNYLELREELILLGNKFYTNSDTEVIIQAYRTWGIECLNRFNGMWAFALWDEPLQRLFISRDRIGEKPLYYSCFDNSFIFGSEIKAVISYGVPAIPKTDVLELYLTMSFVPAPYTFYKDIFQLMPGKYILVEQGSFSIHTYWDLPDIDENDIVKDQQLIEDEFSEIFHDAVRIRMRSDVAFGAFLSGGLDSSCIVSAMTKYTTKPVKTFTIGFKDKEFDESGLAQIVADKFKTHHRTGFVSVEHLNDALEKILFHYDEPFGDSSAIPTGHISKYAAEHVRMVLTGDGGDEVLSGYTTYQGEKFAKRYQQLPSLLRSNLPWLIETFSKPFKGSARYKLNRVAAVLASSNQSFDQRLLSKLSAIPTDDLAGLLMEEKEMIPFGEFYTDTMKSCRFKDPFYKLMFFQHKVTLPGDMLAKVDRMSMAYSIETRIPFLDKRIIELLYKVHKNLKMSGYVNKTILRNSVANQALPKKLLQAPKRGFRVPLRDWFKDETLTTSINSMLLNNEPNTHYNTNKVADLINKNKLGQLDAGNMIWMLLVFNKWINARQALAVN